MVISITKHATANISPLDALAMKYYHYLMKVEQHKVK